MCTSSIHCENAFNLNNAYRLQNSNLFYHWYSFIYSNFCFGEDQRITTGTETGNLVQPPQAWGFKQALFASKQTCVTISDRNFVKASEGWILDLAVSVKLQQTYKGYFLMQTLCKDSIYAILRSILTSYITFQEPKPVIFRERIAEFCGRLPN